MDSRRTWRTLWLILAAICFVVGTFGARTGRIYPWLPAGTAVAACCLLVGLLQGTLSDRVVVAAACALGAGYRLTVFLLPSSLIGFDPDAYAVRAQVYVQTGHQAPSIDGFYEIANGFASGTATVTQLTSLPVETALAFWPAAGGVLLPLLAAGITRTITPKRNAAGIAALVTAFSAPTLQYSFAPIPLFVSSLFVGGFVLALVRRLTTGSVSALLLLVGFASAMGVMHKVPLFVVAGILIFLALPLYLSGSASSYPVVLTVLFGGIALTTQWVYVTTYVTDALPKIIGVLLSDFSVTTPPPPEAAVRYNPRFLSRLRGMMYLPTVLTIGGLSYLIVSYATFWKQQLRPIPTSVLLASVAVTVGILFPGAVLSTGPGFARVGVFAAVFLPSLVATALTRPFGRGGHSPAPRVSGGVKLAVGLVVAFVVVAHLASTPATPDFRDGPRFYLTQGEVTGKEWYERHEADPVYDLYYGDEVVNFPRAATVGGRHFQQVPQPRRETALMSEPLLDQTLLQQHYDTVALRTDVEVYRLKGGRYRLQWSPEATLNRRYSRVYANGHTALFENPNANETTSEGAA